VGHHDPDFPGKLKIAWDIHFKKNSRLRLVLCGSVLVHTSTLEKLRILCLTGGVSRYLEEIDYSRSAEDSYRDLCFSKTGFLFSEFDKIFTIYLNAAETLTRKLSKVLLRALKTLKDSPKIVRFRLLDNYVRFYLTPRPPLSDRF
jgi:hypothetical protein